MFVSNSQAIRSFNKLSFDLKVRYGYEFDKLALQYHSRRVISEEVPMRLAPGGPDPQHNL